MRFSSLTLLLLAATPLAAQQQPVQLTADDYARAERFLGANTLPLVSGTAGRPTWMEDGRFWYRATVPAGAAFIVVDPARGTRQALFDQTKLAAALAAATGGTVTAERLPFQTFEMSKDGRSITVDVQRKTWSCDLQSYTCAPDSARVAPRAPDHASVSPDGRWAVFIRDHNIWAKELAGGRETQLTT
ncbi:MAG TPA: DPP IV N-terminal domain-containing protein, partial [Gemmatimonadaceae bacterium]|nr:DPP IV N-terminal domain-containing protein [Gemmatimonadaceae bacterium]